MVIPTEVGLTSYRVENHNEDKNEEALRLQLDLVDEFRSTAEQRLARYQNLMAKHYNTNVRHRDFQVGDLVLRKVIGAAKDPTQGKLGPNWEGPYRITSWQTTSKPWTEGSFSTHGIRNTSGNTTNRSGIQFPPIPQSIYILLVF